MSDVVVVGGGIAGVSIGYELARLGADRVVLVEAESTLAVHSTGRSAATYLPSYGPPPVRALTVASRSRFDRLAAEFELADPLTPRGCLMVATDELSEHALAEELAAQPELVELTAREALERCRALLPEVVRRAGWDGGGMDIDVLGVHQAYRRGLVARRGSIVTSAPVRSMRPRTGGGWRVVAGEHRLDCDLVVNAAGAWADRVAGMAGVPPAGFTPKRRGVCTAPVDPAAGLGRGDPVVTDTAERWYFRPEGDGVLVSPADADPVEPGDAKPDEMHIARALEAVNDVTRLGLRSVRAVWAGLRTFAPDGGPVVGGWPEHPGFAFYAGQGGYGIQMAPALAEFAASVLLGQSPPADIALEADALAPTRLR